MVEDPNLGTVCSLIGSTADLVAMAPAPYGPVIGTGMSIIGALFGTEPEDPPSKFEEEVNEYLKRIDGQLGGIEDSIGDLKMVMNELTALTQYNILVVEMAYQKLWVDPFHDIHRCVLVI